MVNTDANGHGNNAADRLTSTSAEDTGPTPLRILEKVLIVIVVVLFIICVVVIALLAVEKNKGSETPEDDYYHRDTTCLYSDEAKRIGFPEFLKNVQTMYYEYDRASIDWEPGMTIRELSLRLKERYLPLNVTPAFLKEKTDSAFALLDEIKKKDMDEDKMKPREVKAVQQVKLFLMTVFGTAYDQNFYDGDWLLGPNHFCWQPICDIGYGVNKYGYYVRPESVGELQEVLRRLKLVGETLEQYILNMKLGIKVGMVRSESSCRAGLDAFKQEFKKVAKQNNPKDILKEWFVEHFRNDSFIKMIPKAQRVIWFYLNKQNISSSIDGTLVEGLGEPIVKMFEYLENDHARHCLPHSVSSGIASLPVDYIYVDGARTSTRTTKKLPLTGQPLDGKTTYKNMLPYFTTSDITPEKINRIGEERLKALYPQAVEIAKNLTGESNSETAIREFKKTLNDSRQYYNTAPFPANESDSVAHKNCSDVEHAKIYCPKRWQAMATWSDSCRQIMGMLAPKLVPLFYHTGKKITVPNCPIEMSPDFNPSAGAQSFQDSKRACYKPTNYNLPFFLDNYGPVFSDWSITAHESWPGHHTQIQGQTEYFYDKCGGVFKWLEDVTSSTFFVEGWGLYAENPVIAEDTDTYDDEPLQKYGMLRWQIWRALRLMVDTGLHYRGMNRTTALELFAKYAWDETDLAEKEVTRYQGAPGQATAYMLGQQKIVQLRNYCQDSLGEQFNAQEFHYQVLSQGAAPEAYLDKHIKKYVMCSLDEYSDEVCDAILNPPGLDQGYTRSRQQRGHDLPPMPLRPRYV